MSEQELNVEQKIARVMYLTKMTRGQVVLLIAEMNGVSRQSVYNWLLDLSIHNKARIMFALEEIERDFSEQAATSGITL